eukprot:gene9217-10873_t
MEVFVGIDIGGSHISVGYIDSTGQIIGSAEVKIDSLTLEPSQLIPLIKKMIDDSKEKDWVICSIGIGCPGQSKNGVLVAAGNLPKFINFNIAGALGEVFTSIPILLLNDADAAVSAEVWGKDSKDRYKDFTNIALLTLGTGIGCGLILNQQLHQGSNGLIEAGHMIVATGADGRKCPCGQVGCVEAYSSAYNTSKRLAEADVAGNTGVAPVDPSDGGKDVLARFARGDETAVKVLEETARHLAVLCINLSRVVDPDVIVFTGGLAKAGDVLLQLIEKHMKALAWTILPTNVKLLTAKSLEFGGVVGAALAAKQLLAKQVALRKAAEQAQEVSLAAGGHILEPSMNLLKCPAPELNGLVWSPVESVFLERSGHASMYSNEKIPTVEVLNIYELGKIVSLRFLEWVRANPTGVVALPTGRTPEFFIKTLDRYKTHWNTAEVQAEVQALGFQDSATYPDTTQLKFVMLDEFFPMHSTHRNSFCRYIRTYYVDLLGVHTENGKAKIVRSALEDAKSPERPASALHGHKGARFYVSHGAACMLTARKALRMANTSTERAVQWALSHSAGLTYPGGSEPSLNVTPPQDYLLLEAYLYEQSVRLNIPVHALTPASLASTHTSIGCPSALLDPLTCCALVACAAKRLREKVEAGINASEITNKSIMHTGPHHDDVELSYHGAMHVMLGREQNPDGTHVNQVLGEARGGNTNHFAYLTSGFHSVNESYLQAQAEAVIRSVPSATDDTVTTTFLEAAVRGGEISRDYDDIMTSFREAFFAKNAE